MGGGRDIGYILTGSGGGVEVRHERYGEGGEAF